MACKIDVDVEPNHLRVLVTGENSFDTLLEYAATVPVACVQHQRTRVLVVVRLTGPELPMIDVYKGVSSGSDNSAHLGMRVAWVDENPQRGSDNMRLAESIARSRGIVCKTFRDEQVATRWLLSDQDE